MDRAPGKRWKHRRAGSEWRFWGLSRRGWSRSAPSATESDSDISVGYALLVPMGTPSPVGGNYAWFPLSDVPQLAPRQKVVLDSALVEVRSRIDHAPVAFKLLPQMFTLTELQQMYELLLGKRLHKASFRRALQGAWLVEPTDEWRSEGRGRPAQLYRYAPRKRRPAQRGIRLDLLSS